MADPINTAPPPSQAVSAMSNVNTQTTIQKQVVGVSFGDKMASFMGGATALVANGANTVFGAMGFRAGQAAAGTLSDAGNKLAQMGQGAPGQISTQVHGMSNSMAPNGAPAVALGPGAVNSQQQAAFGAGTGGPGALRQNQNASPAFGAGAIGLDGSSGLSGGVSTGGSGVSTTGGAIGSAAGGDSQGALLNATKQMQETQMSFNLQYLQLQSQMQSENRSYTAVSNIMKTKHDTVKNSISNVR